MDVIRYSFRRQVLDLVQVPMPMVHTRDDVLIKVAYAGISETDLSIIDGKHSCQQVVDVILGKEISGEIVEVGSRVQRLKEGDKVAIYPNIGCPNCSVSRGGIQKFCRKGCSSSTIGIHLNGGWAQYVLVPIELVYKIGEGTSLEQGDIKFFKN